MNSTLVVLGGGCLIWKFFVGFFLCVWVFCLFCCFLLGGVFMIIILFLFLNSKL